MKARDVMVTPVITVKSSSSVREAAATFLSKQISAAPVIDDSGRLVGMISEGDLMRRTETGTERRRSWWLLSLTSDETLAAEFIKSHARKVVDVMTRKVITASPETALHEVATLLEKNSIKRVPIVENGQLVGLVSRANLIQGLATSGEKRGMQVSDTEIRNRLLGQLQSQPWAHTGLLNVTVTDGVVDLWGFSSSDIERKAIRVAAEATAGVAAVNDHLSLRSVYSM